MKYFDKFDEKINIDAKEQESDELIVEIGFNAYFIINILLLDEPTGDLDTRSTDIAMKILVDLNVKEGITMIMVTHDVALKVFANRVVRMADGKIHKIIPCDPNSR